MSASWRCWWSSKLPIIILLIVSAGDRKQMSSQAASMQSYNNELVQCFEAIKTKRDELHRSIVSDEAEKDRIEFEIKKMSQQLSIVNQRLAKNIAARNDIDKTISETEAAYSKIVESSLALLKFVKHESSKGSNLLLAAPQTKRS